MAMKKKPVTGMKDILPKEMAIRDYAIGLIKETYKDFGFTSVETPAVEHIENLTSNQGGENEKLIFKVLKRGDKLSSSVGKLASDYAAMKAAENLSDDEKQGEKNGGVDMNILSDSGLRYDLTLPLSRYYANNANELPSPFKALQMGNVWRADRPQRGRFRQFMQCDIDILGEQSIVAEIELILATTTLLGKLDFKNFTIRINDRRILKAMAAYSGFKEEDYDTVFIILDKMDKIGLDGVKEELLKEGYAETSVEKYLGLYGKLVSTEKLSAEAGNEASEETDKDSSKNKGQISIDNLRMIKNELGEYLDVEVSSNLETIITSVENAKSADFGMMFDPTLVRGMSYYTGPIFEISMDEYGGSVGGGGRYDEMIGKFTGQATPAVGFSIGFERIVMLLLESDFKVPGQTDKKAFLVEKGMPADKLGKIFDMAKQERENGNSVNVVVMKKNKKFQKDKMQEEGYTEFVEFFKDREF
ncbi:MAG: histidine--tRNA ligase [Eubacterium sp.]|nr:histidine--tRNA ligase [Eubacterium sp.]